jgi:hypothetical protein
MVHLDVTVATGLDADGRRTGHICFAVWRRLITRAWPLRHRTAAAKMGLASSPSMEEFVTR